VKDRGQRVTAHWISHDTAQQETETAFKVRHMVTIKKKKYIYIFFFLNIHYKHFLIFITQNIHQFYANCQDTPH